MSEFLARLRERLAVMGPMRFKVRYGFRIGVDDLALIEATPISQSATVNLCVRVTPYALDASCLPEVLAELREACREGNSDPRSEAQAQAPLRQLDQPR